MADETANKELVRKVFDDIFVKHDFSAFDKYYVQEGFVQHNPYMDNGVDAIRELVAGLTEAGSTYELGFITAAEDIVMIHGRFTGYKAEPVIVTDIYRVKDGKLAEHWDVIQDEVPESRTKSGNSMFEPGA
ncbi:nuclear transport factor 2 family protein [Kitasatospora sp. NPDC059599]|uniref:nuclear transport factor 2 family protein n=1 Tax=Kitasatospora sp. NPDC059599 TaxID=3346880 RepID=UPI0036C1BF3F